MRLKGNDMNVQFAEGDRKTPGQMRNKDSRGRLRDSRSRSRGRRDTSSRRHRYDVKNHDGKSGQIYGSNL